MNNRQILVVGAGIAGPVLAWWLERWGFEPTLIEHASTPRTGGTVIDFWGSGWTVIERMGLAEALRAADYDIREVRLVGRDGRRLAALDGAVFRRVAAGRLASLTRGELAEILRQALAGKVEVAFGERIHELRQDPEGVDVVFASGASRRFDLVVAADGLHSATRTAIFGPQAAYEKKLGYRVAVWSAEDYPHRDEGAFVSFCVPGGQLARWSLRGGRTAFFCVYADAGEAEAAPAVLRRLFAGVGWECGAALATLATTGDLYTDDVAQTHVPCWSLGRVALVGDAAYSPSLLAGQGAALATLGACVLAGELHRAQGGHAAAFAAYERLLRPLTAARQKSALGYAGWFAPRTRFGVQARRWGTQLMSLPLLTTWMTRRMLDDRFDLPEYS